MMRVYVRIVDGVVDYVLEQSGPGAVDAAPPAGMLEVTDHPQRPAHYDGWALRAMNAQTLAVGPKLSYVDAIAEQARVREGRP